MSEVRKRNNYYGEDFEKFIDKKIEEGKFTTPGLTSKEDKERLKREVREAARTWIDLSNTKDFENIYSFDRITDTYSLDQNNIPEGFSFEKLQGSDKPVVKNILGAYVIDKENSNKSLNSLVSTWINQYKDTNYKPKNRWTVPDLTEAIITEEYGTKSEIFDNDWFNLSEEDRKNRILNRAKKEIQNYKELKTQYPEDEFINSEKIDAIESAINSNDWDQFKNAAHSAGWDISNLLYTPPAEPEPTIEPTEEKIDQLKRLGVYDDEVINSIVSGGWELENDYDPYGEGWFPEYIRKNKAIIVKDKYGNRRIIKGKELLNNAFTNPTDEKTYGKYWEHDENGFVTFRKPGEEGWKPDYFSSPVDFGSRKLNVTLPNEYANWEAFGYSQMDDSGNLLRDPLNFPDFTKQIVLRREGQDPIELFWSPQGYKTKSGDLFEGLNISGYGTDFAVWNPNLINQENDPFKNIPISTEFSSIKEALGTYENSLNLGKRRGHAENVSKVKSVIGYLKHKIQNGSPVEREQAFEIYNDLLDKFSKDPELLKLLTAPEKDPKKAEDIKLKMPNPTLKKKGGILKAQSGTKMTPEEFVAKYGKKSKTVSDPKNKLSTISDAGVLDIASGISTVASFFPVIGGFGAGATTLIDIARDIQEDDGKINWGTHLGNLAFTGLSFAGLGGLRALKAAAKGAKALDTTFDIAKAAKNVDKLAASGGISEDIYKSVKSLESASKKLGKTNIDDYLKKLRNSRVKDLSAQEKEVLEEFGYVVRKNGSIQIPGSAKTISKLQAAKNIEETKDIALGVQSLKFTSPEVKYLQNLTSKIVKNPIVKKTTPIVATGLLGASTIPAIGDAVSDYREGGLGNIDVDDAKRILMLSSLGTQSIANFRKARAAKIFTKPATTIADKQVLKIADKELPLSKEIAIPKKSGKIGKKEFAESDLNKFKLDLEEAGVQNSDEIVNLLKSGKTAKVKTIPGSTSGLVTDVTTEKILENPTEFLLAQKVFKTGFRPYGAWKGGLTQKTSNEIKKLQKDLESVNKKLNTSKSEEQLNSLREKHSRIVQELAGKSYFKDGGIIKAQSGISINPVNSTLPWGFSTLPEFAKKPKAKQYNSNIYEIIAPPGEVLKSLHPDLKSIKLPGKNTNMIEEIVVKKEGESKLQSRGQLAESSEKPLDKLVISNRVNTTPLITRKESSQINTLQGVSFNPISPNTKSFTGTNSGWSSLDFNQKYKDILGYIKDASKYITPTTIANIFGYLKTKKTNKELEKLQKTALMNSLVKPELDEYKTYAISSDVDMPYKQKAGEMKSKGEKIASATTDFNPAVQLESQRLANQLELEGAYKKHEDIKQQKQQQELSNAAITQRRLEALNKYKYDVAGVAGRLPLITSQRKLSDNANLNRLFLDTASNLVIQDRKLAFEKAALSKFDPEYKQMKEDEGVLLNSLEEYRKNWEEYLKTPEGRMLENKEFENSPQYKKFEQAKEMLQKKYEPYLKKQAKYNAKIYFAKSGGSLENKVTLEKLKQAHRLEIQYFKDMEKRSESVYKLMLESLKMIFG